MRKNYILALSFAAVSLSAAAQHTITGTVKDSRELPVLGAVVSVVGNPGKSVLTDQDGAFAIEAEQGDYIEVVYADCRSKRVWIDSPVVNVSLESRDAAIENRGVLRTAENQTQSIATLSGEDIWRNSTPGISNALYGLIPGLTVQQNTSYSSGGASLSIHGQMGRSPLIVVDGIPRNLEYLNSLEIESVSVLKDGAATALWGTRGASGVIMVTTKRGQYKERDIDVSYTYGMGIPVNEPEFVDGYTYALMKNEALYYDGLTLQYDQAALTAFRNGSNPDLYPNVDWLDAAQRKHSVNNQFNISFRGGGDKLRYYTLINYKNDYGILSKSWSKSFTERYNSQMRKYDLNVRMNLDVDVTRYTKVALSMFGLLREENRPNITEENIYASLYHTPASAFPIRTTTNLWGGDEMFGKNPIAQIADVGYYKTNRRLLQSDLRILQDLSMWTEGLKAEVGIAYDNDAVFQETGSKNYDYEINTPVRLPATGDYTSRKEVRGDNSALSVSNTGLNSQFIRLVIDAKVGYDRAFGLHGVTGTLQYRQESYTPMGRNNTRKRQSYIFTGGYNYAGKYMLDVVVNRSGTSVLSDGDKFRTYPAVSAGWIISNENFMKNQSVFDFLKLRASWGRSGNDDIAYDLDERFWITAGGAQFQNPPVGFGGIIAGTLPITDLTIEMSDKYNVGLDLGMLNNRLSLTFDGYYDKRKDMLVDGTNMYSAVIGTGIPQQNIGQMNAKGIDLGVKWADKAGRDFNYYVGGTFSWLKTEVEENGEGYQPYDYLSKKGDRVGQCYGLEAIGYFNDWEDINNSPSQLFSDVRPGDIKYKDQNGDGRIDDYDVVPIGYSTTVPGIYYGINLGFEYRGFGMDMVFQGVGQFSKMLNVRSVYWPMRNGNSNLTKWYLEDNIRWTEDTKDIATVPRLTTLDNANNFRNSTQWLENGSYFKLRNLNIYYNLPDKWAKAMKMDKCQVYVRANNLFSIDHIKYMNCEDLTINYPDMTSVYFGLNINF